MSGYMFTSKHHGVDVEVDLSSQVLELEVDEQESFSALWGQPHRQRRPEVHLTDEQGRAVSSQQVSFTKAKYTTVCPMIAELYVSRVPDRAELQALCDQPVSTSAILEALGRRPPRGRGDAPARLPSVPLGLPTHRVSLVSSRRRVHGSRPP